MCFPDEMGGMPYTTDELPEDMTKGFESKVGTGTASDPEVQTPKAEEKKPEPAKVETTPEPQKEQSVAQTSYLIKEGDPIPTSYWQKTSAAKLAMLPEGCGARKVEGVFRCVRL
jgi:hypothetical protein